MEKHEQLITSAKAGLTTVRNTLSHSPSQWKKHTDTVRTCVNNIETSNIMLGSNRLEERLWFITEIQEFAYFDADSGSIADLAAWCEREWNRVLSTDSTNIDALRGMIVFVLYHQILLQNAYFSVKALGKHGFQKRNIGLPRSIKKKDRLLALKKMIGPRRKEGIPLTMSRPVRFSYLRLNFLEELFRMRTFANVSLESF
jgi:hypothetical protein